ncbi:hypothetical protein DICPUDRAFT_80340 [Dictyostelium purpureum]|uniref:Uncharacterized protein n=1 Tax=Dictyostelium purpureum TaxID=5786 RepID=F0ZQ75_DICPU|nr:uncharacterized protein DICPUDRAFT_80340 [Dictyostelium purpureum]EGC33886.1 hypothetical protein DICPUDRAFT_80340 [Dictyostelium purpureum]|eukprot:XP_003289569.1 hypothetical protein DICPUDRAFT_80340 [Dictyostelium purpureum]
MINNYNRENYNFELPNYPNKYKIPYKKRDFNYIFKSNKKSEYLIRPKDIPQQLENVLTFQEYLDIYSQCRKQINKRQLNIRIFFYASIISSLAFVIPFVLVLTLTHASHAMVTVPIGLFIYLTILITVFAKRRYNLEIEFNALIKDLNTKYSHKGITIYKKYKYHQKGNDRAFETHRDYVNRIYIFHGYPQEQAPQQQTPQPPIMYQISNTTTVTSASPPLSSSSEIISEKTPLLKS